MRPKISNNQQGVEMAFRHAREIAAKSGIGADRTQRMGEISEISSPWRHLLSYLAFMTSLDVISRGQISPHTVLRAHDHFPVAPATTR
jgi:hypothetical protein